MANRYFVNGGVDSNWGTIGNWSTTSGGAGGSAVPLNTDDVFFDANSPACTVNTSSRVALTLTFTGYVNTITMSQQITVNGNITLASGMTIAGSGALICATAATLTSAGKTWPNALTLNGVGVTYTLADDWTVSGLATLGLTTTTVTINGNTLNLAAGLTCNMNTGSVTGTTLIKMIGTGTITGSTIGGALKNNLTIDTAGTITISSAQVFSYNTGTLTYTAGTVVTTGSTLSCILATTFATNGITWNNVTLLGAATHTLTNNLSLTGLLTLCSSSSDTIVNGSTINASGGITFGGTSGSCYGTTILNVNATSTLSAPSITVGEGIDMPITFNAPGGTITVSSGFRCNLGKLSYTAGAVIAGNTWASSGSAAGRQSMRGGFVN